MCVHSVAQFCLTPFDPMGFNPQGSSVHGISQARILKCIVISFFRGSSCPRDQTCISCISNRFFITKPPEEPMLFTADCLFFIFYRSLLKISCIFLIYASILFILLTFYFQDFGLPLLSLLWILFQVDWLFPLYLFGLVGFFHVPSSTVSFSVFSFSLICCLKSPFWSFPGHISFYFWILLPVDGDIPMSCEDFLIGRTAAYLLADGAGSWLSERQCCTQWCVLGLFWGLR